VRSPKRKLDLGCDHDHEVAMPRKKRKKKKEKRVGGITELTYVH
jgi:hypothetical protein